MVPFGITSPSNVPKLQRIFGGGALLVGDITHENFNKKITVNLFLIYTPLKNTMANKGRTSVYFSHHQISTNFSTAEEAQVQNNRFLTN